MTLRNEPLCDSCGRFFNLAFMLLCYEQGHTCWDCLKRLVPEYEPPWIEKHFKETQDQLELL